MGSLVLTIKTQKQPSAFAAANQDNQNLSRIMNLISGLNVGALSGTVDIQYDDANDPAAASGTFTLTSAVATDAITIGTVTLTASSTPGTDEWEIDGADDAADAAALAAAINAHATLSKVVSATSASNVVTISALQKGLLGNQLPISSADATIVASGSFLAGGTGGAASASVQINR
jgi:phage tail sheath gpL-like